MKEFVGARLKIERAKQHIGDLHNAVRSFQKTKFYSLWVEEDPQTGDSILQFGVVQKLPPDIGLITGDAIHNLHAALDILIHEVIWDKLSERSKRDYFPIREKRSEVAGIIKSGKIHQADFTLCDLIVDVIRPYKGGNDPLLALHELDKIDKHRILIPWIQVTGLLGVYLEDSNGNMLPDMGLTIDGAGRVFSPIRTSGKLRIKSYGEPACHVLFDKGLPLEGQPLMPALHQLTQLVAGIVEIFERHYS